MVVMVNRFFAKQAMVLLHFRDGFFKACFLIERTLLILPFLNVRIIQLHKRKFINLKHNITDRKKLLNFLHQVNVCLQQLICGRCEPTFWSCAITELCFFVFNADAKDFFLTTWKMTLDDTNFLCTLADTAILSSGLLYALFRNGAICFGSPLTAASSAIGASCTARVFALFHQFRNFLVAGFQMRSKDCCAVRFNNSNTDISSAGVDTQVERLHYITGFIQQLNGKRFCSHDSRLLLFKQMTHMSTASRRH